MKDQHTRMLHGRLLRPLKVGSSALIDHEGQFTLVETSLILYLMREYHVNVPLRTQGWIKERLTAATVQEDFCGSVTYYRAKKEPLLTEVL